MSGDVILTAAEMGRLYPLVQNERRASAGAANEEIVFGPVPTGVVWQIRWLALEDETSNFTYLRAYIGGMGEPHYLFEVRSPLAARLYWTHNPIDVPETRTLVLRFNGTTSADRLAAFMAGTELRKAKVKNA